MLGTGKGLKELLKQLRDGHGITQKELDDLINMVEYLFDSNFCLHDEKEKLETRVKELEIEAFDATFVAVALLQSLTISPHTAKDNIRDAKNWLKNQGENRWLSDIPEGALKYFPIDHNTLPAEPEK